MHKPRLHLMLDVLQPLSVFSISNRTAGVGSVAYSLRDCFAVCSITATMYDGHVGAPTADVRRERNSHIT